MKVVYIAGPFRGPTPWDVECNIRDAEGLALAVAQAGAMPLCPHTMMRYFDKQCTDGFWLEGALELLRRCDAVLFAELWEESKGSVGEHEEAVRRGMPVFYETGFEELEQLEQWLQSGEYRCLEDPVVVRPRGQDRVRQQHRCHRER